MTGAEAWGHWQVGNTLQLASYVVQDAFRGAGLVPPDIHDLRAEPEQAVATLYERLAGRGLHYDIAEPIAYAGVQAVREPYEVLQDRRATCLDIALLFAGLCLHAGLRPLVAVFQRADRSAHALVIVPPHPAGERDEVVWAHLTPVKGLLLPSFADLHQLIEHHGWIAVETTGVTHRNGGLLSFADARRAAVQALKSSAERISLLDPAHHQRGGKYQPLHTRRVPPDQETPADRDEAELDRGVRERYGEWLRALAAELREPPPTRWNREELRRLADRAREPAHRETLAALLDAAAARRVLDHLGATRGSIDQLRHLYARHVGCWPDPRSTSLDALLTDAASATIREHRTADAPRRTLCALAAFVLSLAAAGGTVTCDDPDLRALLTEHLGQQLFEADDYLETKCRGRAWLLIDLGDDSHTGALEWPSGVTATLVEADGRIGWTDTVPCEPTQEGLKAGLRALLRQLPDDMKLLVDLIAPHALFGQGIDRWPVVEIADWAESFHELGYAPRYRWSKRERHGKMLTMLRDRADEADWTRPPPVVPPQEEAELRRWLRANPQPYRLAAAEPLPVLLKQGYGFIAWYPSGSVPDGDLAGVCAGRPDYALRAELPDHLAGPDDTVIIWDDPHGRGEFRRPRRRALESPRNIGVAG